MTINKFTSLALIALLAALGLKASAEEAEHELASPASQARLANLIDTDERPERHRARDQYRHPLETLAFSGIEPGMTVAEIDPGGQGGWYRRIIEPLLEDEGKYVPISMRDLWPGPEDDIPYGEIDLVLVFRAHGFVHPPLRGEPQEYVDALYGLLKPGGIFVIVDHAGVEEIPQDMEARHGYVNESFFSQMALKAGFRMLAASDINRNPKDTKDYPMGLYSLPPSLMRSEAGSEERARYLEIGESDRFTHKYYKPFEE